LGGGSGRSGTGSAAESRCDGAGRVAWCPCPGDLVGRSRSRVVPAGIAKSSPGRAMRRGPDVWPQAVRGEPGGPEQPRDSRRRGPEVVGPECRVTVGRVLAARLLVARVSLERRRSRAGPVVVAHPLAQAHEGRSPTGRVRCAQLVPARAVPGRLEVEMRASSRLLGVANVAARARLRGVAALPIGASGGPSLGGSCGRNRRAVEVGAAVPAGGRESSGAFGVVATIDAVLVARSPGAHEASPVGPSRQRPGAGKE